jgi:hypothetical protein
VVAERQKVWTTRAHISAFGLIVAHESRRAPHKGMTAFLVDMKAPGVEVRPLFRSPAKRILEVFHRRPDPDSLARRRGRGMALR